MKQIAQIISIIFHPLWMPTVGIYLILNSNTYAGSMPEKLDYFILALVGLITFLVPLTSIPLLYNFKKIKSIQLEDRNERIIPFLITLISYLFCIYSFNSLQIRLPILIYAYLLGSSFVLLVVVLVSFKWKISAHMAGIGGLLAALLYIALAYQGLSIWYFFIVLFISGWVASARLFLGAHNTAQITVGTVSGFAAMGIVILLLLG